MSEKELGEMTADELADKAAADAAELEKAEGHEVEPEKKEEPKVDASAAAMTEAVNKLSELLKPGISPEQRESEIKRLEEESGFSRKQLGWMSKAMENTAISAGLGSAKELGRSKAREALGDLSDSLMDKVAEAMSKLPTATQANPEAWSELAYLIKGKYGDKTKGSGRQVESGAGGGYTKGLTGTTKGGGASTVNKSKKSYDSDEQTIIDRYFEGNSEDYENRKSSKTITASKKSTETSGNSADKELMRLTGGVS